MKESTKVLLVGILGILGILLVAIALIAIVYVTIEEFSDKDITHNNVTLRPQDYKAIQEQFGDKDIVKVCNLDNGNCIALYKFGDKNG